MQTLVLILNIRAAVFLKGVLDTRWHGIGKNLATAIIFGGVAMGTFLAVRTMLAYLVHQVGVDIEAMHRLLAFGLFSFFASVYTIGLLVSYATLYTSDDVALFMALPVSHGVLFIERAVENVVTSGGTLALLGAAAVLAYGSVFHVGFWQYLAIIFGAFLPAVMATGLFAVLTLPPLVILAGRIGVRRVIAVAVTLFVASTALLLWSTDPLEIMRQVALPASHIRVDPSHGIATLAWLPSNWVAWFLQALAARRATEAIAYPGLVLGSLAFTMLAADMIGRRWYYRSWLIIGEMRALRSPTTGWFRFPPMEFGRFWGFRPHLEAVLKRDFWMFLRDPVQRVHLLIFLLLTGGTVLTFQSLDVMVNRPVSRVLMFSTVFLFIGLVVGSITLRFVFPSVGLEGSTFWAVRTAPIALSRLYWMKFGIALAWTMVPAVAMVFLVMPVAGGPASLTYVGAAGMAAVVVAVVSLNLGAGAYFATLREDNPLKIASSQGASVTFLGSFVVLLLAAGFLIVPVAVIAGLFRPAMGPAAVAVSLSVLFALALIVTLLSHLVGLRALRKDF